PRHSRVAAPCGWPPSRAGTGCRHCARITWAPRTAAPRRRIPREPGILRREFRESPRLRVNPVQGSAEAHFFAFVSFVTLVKVAVQFVSQVLPPSVENACSQRGWSGFVTVHRYRTRIVAPFQSS